MGGCDGFGKRKSMSSVVGMPTFLFDTKQLASTSTYKHQNIDTYGLKCL